jgi:hypothetical protein
MIFVYFYIFILYCKDHPRPYVRIHKKLNIFCNVYIISINRRNYLQQLKISLLHSDLIKTKCSAIFLKHIEGSMSAPELGLNEEVGGRLKKLNSDHEKEDHSELETGGLLACSHVYVVNFHKQDLPFSYRSVDRYARTIINVAASGIFSCGNGPLTVATAIHGPGAGLDSSEAMETLIVAFASELGAGRPLGPLDRTILVENKKDVFERLEERLKYLATKNILKFEEGEWIINPTITKENSNLEQGRVNRLALKHFFIAMPYAKEFNNVYYFGIKQPIEQRGRKSERVDQDAFTGDVVERIKHRISNSEMVIADITGNNPNVFFEVGYSEGVGKKVILISQEEETPFDLKTVRKIPYDPQDILSLANSLGELLDGIIETDSGVPNLTDK